MNRKEKKRKINEIEKNTFLQIPKSYAGEEKKGEKIELFSLLLCAHC
jgi:hypothetical protein